jgi:hypothetical protein
VTAGGDGAALLVVRSVVARPEDRPGFDRWYRTDHMPKAIAWLGAVEGWRYWSATDPSVHYAVYRYPSLEALHTRDDANRRALMAEYEAAWPGVSRTREVLLPADPAGAAVPAPAGSAG